MVEFRLNEGEKITEFHEKSETTFWDIIGGIFIIPIFLLFLVSIFSYLLLIFSYEVAEGTQIRIVIFLTLLIYIVHIIDFIIAQKNESSQLCLFQEYILINKAGNKLPGKIFKPLKIPFSCIDYFILNEIDRIKIVLKKTGIETYKNLNKNFSDSDLNYYDYENLDRLFHLDSLIIDKKFKKNKNELVTYLNLKTKSKMNEVL